MAEENVCKICNDKLKKKEDSAIYYCVKCGEVKKKKESIFNKQG